MAAKLITGNLNKPIYASQDSDYQAGLSGNKTSIAYVGNQMAYEIEDANTIAIKDGVLVTKEGRRVQIDVGAIEEFTIPTGSQGVTRYYLIGFHLYTDTDSSEKCETFVIEKENATDTIVESTFRSGSTEVYVTMYRVTQSGLTISNVQALLGKFSTLRDITDGALVQASEL